jgi:hypothetical protein
MWNILNRLLCLLLPFEELRKGHARAISSIDTKYATVPPQLAFWRALFARHFFLAVVCVTSVSTNILAVSLSALLNLGSTSVAVPFPSKYKLSPQFNGTRLFDDKNLAGQYYASLPPLLL